MAYDYYCEYGMKVKKEVLESFQEYKDLMDFVSKYEVAMYYAARSFNGDEDMLIEELEEFLDVNSDNNNFASITSQQIVEEIDNKINALLIAFSRKYRGYSMHLRAIEYDEIYNSDNIANDDSYIFVITDPYKANIKSIAEPYDYIGGY